MKTQVRAVLRLLILLTCFSTSCLLQAQRIVDTVFGGSPPVGLPATEGVVGSPHGLTLDPSGNLIFGEGYTIRRINASSGI
ncbi:MAG TPA: hypothetical protein VH640_24690, partial [Bryobacteraceae bacterium]